MSVAELESPVQLHPQYGTRKKTKSPKERARAAKRQEHAGDPFDLKVMAIHNLRVRIKSLVEESRILRKEEKRAGIRYQWILHERRVGRHRSNLRYAGLALAFLRKRPYREVEFHYAGDASAAEIMSEIRDAYLDYDLECSIRVTDILQWLSTGF